MLTRYFAPAVGVVVASVAFVCSIARSGAPAPTDTPAIPAGGYTLTGPHTHDNLTIYLIHGPDRLKDRHYVTFQEAIEKKFVIVHETGDVNELQIENVSPDQDVFVQSGDIVKGGRQDRTIASDFICPAKSGKMPINAFCVEHGRWSGRGGEAAAYFGSSKNSLAGKDLKLAAQLSSDQREVWEKVAQNQSKLGSNAGRNVADVRSSTSFELTLENDAVKATADAYKKDLAKIIDHQDDAIGYAMAINGKVNSADVYASHELFVKLWPKLLDSAAVEAFAELQKDKKFEPVKVEQVKETIEGADKGKASEKDVTPRVRLVTKESQGTVVFECRDRQSAPGAAAGQWLHRNYLAKDKSSPAPEQEGRQQLQLNNTEPNAPARQTPPQPGSQR